MECVMNSKKIIQLSTTLKIMLSFLCAILVGSFLLALPISSAIGEAVPYIDALFTATTSICVTGLVTVPTYSTWSVWGQIVILFLIQLGGLGVITVMYGVMMGLHRRLGLGNRWMLQDVFNLNDELITGRPTMRGGKYGGDRLPTTCHVYFGEVIGATANGRKANVPVSEGISPEKSADTNGPTAVLKSVSR